MDPSQARNRSNYFLTDFFVDYDEVKSKLPIDQVFEEPSDQNIEDQRKLSKIKNKFLKKIKIFSNYLIWVYYIALAVSVAMTMFTIQQFIYHIKTYIEPFKQKSREHYILINVLMGCLSTATCQYFGVEAQSAGLPELKCILSGGKMLQFLQLRVLVGKIVSLTFSILSGLYIGILGPMAHIGALIAYNLVQLKIFKDLKRDNVVQYESIMIGTAVGMCISTNCPFSALFFGIEMAGKLNTIKTIWVMFVTVYVGKVSFELMQIQFMENYFQMNQKINTINNNIYNDLYLYGLLGLVCGIGSVVFVKLAVKYQLFRMSAKTPSIFRSRYKYTIMIITMTSLIRYYYQPFQLSIKQRLNEFMNHHNNLDLTNISNNLFYMVVTLALVLTNISVPVASGAVGPLMVYGGMIGLVYISIITQFKDISDQEINYLFISAIAAVSSTTTRFLSIVLYVIECLGTFDLSQKIILTTVFSLGIANLLAKSFLYSTIELKKLPFLPKLMKTEVYEMQVHQIIKKMNVYLYMDSKFHDIFIFLTKSPEISLNDHVPILRNKNDPQLVAIVKVQNILLYFKKQLKNIPSYQQRNLKTINWISQIDLLIQVYLDQQPEIKTSSANLCNQVKQQLAALYLDQNKEIGHLLDKHQEHEPNETATAFIQDRTSRQLVPMMKSFTALVMEERQSIYSARRSIVDQKKIFMMRSIDYDSEVLNINRSPLTVSLQTKLCKVHFLFIQLQVSKIYVTDKGVLKGIIDKSDFLGLNHT